MGVAVLGPLEVDGHAGLGPRDRVVLAALVSQRHEAVSAERLADALWRGDQPATWTKVVQGCVSRIRRSLGADAVETTPAGYLLTLTADDVDAYAFERLLHRARELADLGDVERARFRLGRALALWRGTALPELEGWEPGEAVAARLAEDRRDAEELELRCALSAGHWREVLAPARALVAAEPLREGRWAVLATALYHAGQQAEALATLRRARSMLAEELGLDPGRELVRLEQAVLRQDSTLDPGHEPGPMSDACPYRGLVSYGPEDSESFFGREEETEHCLRVLRRHGVLALVGPSGCGKSSLLHAGLVARLAREGVRVREVPASPEVLRPGVGPSTDRAAPGWHAGEVVVVDQLEDLFADDVDTAARTLLLDALAAHAGAGGLLVVAVRADRLGDLAGHPAVAQLVERGLHLLGPMSGTQLRAAVTEPARQAGLLLEPGLADLLVAEVEDEPGGLPLLSHALVQTWARREGRTLTVAGYQAAGGVRGAVTQTAEQLFHELDGGQRRALRELLVRLTARPRDGDPVRRRLPRRALPPDEEHGAVVERLVSARLVTSDESGIELAHEALARAWPRLRTWLDEDVAGQQLLRHLSVAADSWSSMGRPTSELYRGTRLERALAWRDGETPGLTPVEAAFLEASEAHDRAEREAAEQRARQDAATASRLHRQRRLLVVALSAAVVVGSVAVERGVSASRSADLADARARAATAGQLAAANEVAETDWPLALLLATEARRVADTPLTRRGQLSTLLSPAPLPTGLHRDPGGFQAVALDEETGSLLVGDPEGAVSVLDPATGRRTQGPLPAPAFPIAGGLDAGHGMVAAGGLSRDGVGTVIYAIGRDEPLHRVRTPVDEVSKAAFSPDGTLLAVARPGAVRVLSTDTWRRRALLTTGDGEPLLSVAWSGNGRRVYAGGPDRVHAWRLPGPPVSGPVPVSGSARLTGSSDPSVVALAALPGTDRIAATTFGGASYLLAGSPLRVVQGPLLHEHQSPSLAVSPDGSRLAVAALDRAEVWAVDGDGAPRRVATVRTDTTDVAFTPDGKLVTVGEGGRVTRWETEPTSPVLRPLDLRPGIATYSDDGLLLAVWGFGLGVDVLAAGTLDPVASLALPDPGRASLAGVTFLPGGRRIAVLHCPGTDVLGREYCPGRLTVFDVTTGDAVVGPVRTPPLSHWNPTLLAASADGRLLATGHSGGVVQVRDAETLAVVAEPDDLLSSPEAVHVVQVDFSGSGSRLVASTGVGTAVWSLAGDRPRLLARRRTGGPVLFLPDGKVITSAPGEIAVRGPTTLATVVRRDASPGWAVHPSVSSDGRVLVTDDDGSGRTRIWTLPSLELLAGPLDAPAYATVQPDGLGVLIGGPEPAELSLRPGDWDAAACQAAGRDLTAAEWDRYFPGEAYRSTCG